MSVRVESSFISFIRSLAFSVRLGVAVCNLPSILTKSSRDPVSQSETFCQEKNCLPVSEESVPQKAHGVSQFVKRQLPSVREPVSLHEWKSRLHHP